MISFLLPFVIGLAIGGSVVWLVMRAQQGSETQWNDRFSSIAAEALRQSHESFLQLAESRLKQSELAAAATLDKKTTAIDELMKPVKETLNKMDTQLKEIELTRHGAYKELMQAVSLSNDTQQKLRAETSQLLQALRTPTTRGQWGEIQVRRILEMTGMNEHCRDFSSQHHIASEEGNMRPDYLVRLPGDRCIIIDSKVPLASYLDGAQSNDAGIKQTAMEKHARQVREHIRALSSKAYWDQIGGSADFVVLFVPGDHFLAGALDCDPDLIEYSTLHNVVLATPMTLVALLRTVALGWRQENLRENAEKLGTLGGELYAAIVTMADHVSDMGRKLTGSLDSYNKMIGSLERNVLSKARRLRDFGANKEGKELADPLDPIDKQPRALQALDGEEKEDAA
ncbi:MAG: DNA recombination protein RmuC [Bdellovibrionales bacterium]